MTLITALRSNHVFGLIFLVCVLLIGAATIGRPGTQWLRNRPPPSKNNTYDRDSSEDPLCHAFPDSGNIAIAVKTGATEAAEKVPMLMLTTLRCAKNVMIFSDLEQKVAGYQLHDALADIPRSAMQGNSDFDFYWKLREAQKYGQVETMLKGLRDPRITHDLAAWTLDKYKFLHVLENLYAQYPDKDWYLIIEADTYVVWPNLLSWLHQLDHSTKLYLGSPAVVRDVQFAHGGSGILLSRAAMYDFAVVNEGSAARWDKPMHEECCGDLIVGTLLKNSGIALKPSWPTINGEKPITLPFGPTHWCQPVVTMHHVQPPEMNQLSNFEISRNNTRTPLTFSELFNAFTRDVLPESLPEWNNLCLDGLFEVESFEACHDTCVGDAKCFQFAFNGKQCTLSHSIHLGGPAETWNDVKWSSGWLKDRINKWADDQAPCEPEFPWT